MNLFIKIILLSFLSNTFCYAQISNTKFKFSTIDISHQEAAQEQSFNYLYSQNKDHKIGFLFENSNRFEIQDKQLNALYQFNTEKWGIFNLSLGVGEKGKLYSFHHELIENYYQLNQYFSFVNGLNQRSFIDAQVGIFHTGFDIETNSPFLFITRFYYTTTNFENIENDSYGSAFLIKTKYSIDDTKSLTLYHAQGKEGILRSQPPQMDLIFSSTLGTSVHFKISKNFGLQPEFEQQRYQEIDLVINRLALQLDYLW